MSSDLFVCVDRNEARLPNFFCSQAPVAIVLGSEMLGPLQLPIWLDYPVGWTMVAENRGRSERGKLEIAKLGLYWFVGRRLSEFEIITETIVEAFGHAPICAHTPCDAMLIAEGFHLASESFSIGAGWEKF